MFALPCLPSEPPLLVTVARNLLLVTVALSCPLSEPMLLVKVALLVDLSIVLGEARAATFRKVVRAAVAAFAAVLDTLLCRADVLFGCLVAILVSFLILAFIFWLTAFGTIATDLSAGFQRHLTCKRDLARVVLGAGDIQRVCLCLEFHKIPRTCGPCSALTFWNCEPDRHALSCCLVKYGNVIETARGDREPIFVALDRGFLIFGAINKGVIKFGVS